MLLQNLLEKAICGRLLKHAEPPVPIQNVPRRFVVITLSKGGDVAFRDGDRSMDACVVDDDVNSA